MHKVGGFFQNINVKIKSMHVLFCHNQYFLRYKLIEEDQEIR